MAQLLTILCGLGAIIWSFFSPKWAWLPIGVMGCLLLTVLISLKQKKWRHFDELSSSANDLLQRFGHYYAMPAAGRDFSAAASTLQFVAIGVSIVGAFKGFWWGLLIGVGCWLLLGPVAMAFNPTNFLRDPLHQLAHEELIQWLTARRSQ